MAEVGVSGWTLRLEVTTFAPVPAADVQSAVAEVVDLLEQGQGAELDEALRMIRGGEIQARPGPH
ncbi:MAG TPA: hypothetical protein VGW74_19790 [Propionibacteriaceae bacterium]|nr:hypothetical protein [Propionibacteriaceae bacterium]